MNSRKQKNTKRHAAIASRKRTLKRLSNIPISDKVIQSIPLKRVGEVVTVAKKVIQKAESFENRQREKGKEEKTRQKGEMQQRWREVIH